MYVSETGEYEKANDGYISILEGGGKDGKDGKDGKETHKLSS